MGTVAFPATPVLFSCGVPRWQSFSHVRKFGRAILTLHVRGNQRACPLTHFTPFSKVCLPGISNVPQRAYPNTLQSSRGTLSCGLRVTCLSSDFGSSSYGLTFKERQVTNLPGASVLVRKGYWEIRPCLMGTGASSKHGASPRPVNGQLKVRTKGTVGVGRGM